MKKSNFNEVEYKAEWKKENMKSISFRYNKGFVVKFREACEKQGLKQSDVFREAMQNVIDKMERE